MTLKLLGVIYLLLSFNLQAQEVSEIIHVETPGTLNSLIQERDKYSITNLKLSGYLNGTDIRYIREMAGSDIRGDSTGGKLSLLDISDANIVAGGEFYFYSLSFRAIYLTSLNKLGDYTFYGCTSLTSIALPDNLLSIGNEVFTSTRLTSITIPENVTSIGSGAFWGNESLTSITIPNSVTYIGAKAFYGCRRLTSVVIGANLTSISSNAFEGCTGLKEFIVSENNRAYCSAEGVLFSKDKSQLVTYPNAKSNVYVIPKSVKSILSNAFYGCIGLTSITIPSSVTSLAECVFTGCTGLTSITIPKSVTSIAAGAFGECTGLTSITIPNSVTSIAACTFRKCTGLTSVTIPNSVTSFGFYSFGGCTGLTSVAFGRNVTSIDIRAFDGCTGLISIRIPGKVSFIGVNAFRGCKGLKKISVSRKNKVYRSVKGVLFDKNVTKLITYPNNKYKTYTIPNSVTSIETSAFYECTNLTKVMIPNGVKSIESHVFYNCTGLTSVTIPDSVTSVGFSAFGRCKSLMEIHCKALIPPSVSSYAFEFVMNNCRLYVPKGKSANYRTVEGWSSFTNIAEESQQ